MLTKIKLSNFKSFKNETIIDFSSTKYTILKHSNTYNDTLKGCMFVGGNASGKTNAIYSISILLDLLFSNTTIDIPVNFCFFSNDPEMKLEYTFKFDNDTIVYLICFDRKGVITKEVLSLNDQTMLNRLGVEASTILTENKYYHENDIDKKTLFLKSIYFNTKFTKFSPLQKWFEYMSNSVYFNAERTHISAGQALAFNIKNKVNIRDYLDTYGVDTINEFFDYFGFNQKIAYQNSQKLSEYVTAQAQLGTKQIYMKRNEMNVWIPIDFESLGNKTLLNMLPGLLYVIKKGGMFIVDEFCSAFHDELEELIIKYFMYKSTNAQMFFVSHSTNLMKTTLLRPDQIYTVSFETNNGSVIKRVSSEQPRESQNLEKMYLSGIFGGLPNYSNKGIINNV